MAMQVSLHRPRLDGITFWQRDGGDFSIHLRDRDDKLCTYGELVMYLSPENLRDMGAAFIVAADAADAGAFDHVKQSDSYDHFKRKA